MLDSVMSTRTAKSKTLMALRFGIDFQRGIEFPGVLLFSISSPRTIETKLRIEDLSKQSATDQVQIIIVSIYFCIHTSVPYQNF